MSNESIRKMKIGNTGMEVSVVSLGTLSIGGESVWGDSDEKESIGTIERAHEIGINFVDTAPVYGFGRSEVILGKVVAGKRDEYIISSKCALTWDKSEEGGSLLYSRDGYDVMRNATAKSIKKSVTESLMRLKTDYLDICFTHWQAVEPFLVPIEETMGALCDLKKEGKIRAIGASNVDLDQIKEYMKYGQLDIIQNRFSMLDQESFRTLNSFCLVNNITFHAYSPFERGLLTGAVDMNFVVNPGDARSNVKWYQSEKRRQVLDMLESWKPLCEKYNCTQAGLTVAWTSAQAPNVNVDSGSRRIKAIEENARGGMFVLDNTDKLAMNAAIEKLIAQP